MNGFEAYAEEAIPRVVKKRDARRDERASRMIEVHQEREALSKSYRLARKEWLMSFVSGPGGDIARSLLSWIEQVTIDDADALVARIRQSTWLRQASADMRFLILSEIDRRIIDLREKAGLNPFDDPMPDEEPNAFIIIRGLLQ